MTCEQARELLAGYIAGKLDATAEFAYRGHLNGCAMCKDEAEEAARMWALLADIPPSEPPPQMRDNFYRVLEAYQQGQSARAPRFWFRWTGTPAWQAALAVLLLGIGIASGYLTARKSEDTAAVAGLRAEVNHMRQLVTLSLLDQQSASGRLQGVNWSYRVAQSDTEVLGALLRTLNTDTNVNVRLAAADALRSFADSPVVRKSVMQSLLKQTSPLVQIAILDLLAELRDRQAVQTIEMLLNQDGLDENVRRRARWALDEIE